MGRSSASYPRSSFFINCSSDFVFLPRRNRLGLFFFILSLFAFNSLTSLGLFANERLLFMRERFVSLYLVFLVTFADLDAPASPSSEPTDTTLPSPTSSPKSSSISSLFESSPLSSSEPSSTVSSDSSQTSRRSGSSNSSSSSSTSPLRASSCSSRSPSLTLDWRTWLEAWLCSTSEPSRPFVFSRDEKPVADHFPLVRRSSNSLLFGGLLMNYNQSSLPVRVFMSLSFFHAAYEGLLVNELRSTRLVDHKVSSRFRHLSLCLLLSRRELTLIFSSSTTVRSRYRGTRCHDPFHFRIPRPGSFSALSSSSPRVFARRAYSFSIPRRLSGSPTSLLS